MEGYNEQKGLGLPCMKKAALMDGLRAKLNLNGYLLNRRRWRARWLRWSGWLRLLLGFRALVRRQNRMKNGPFHAGHKFDDRDVSNVLDQAVDDVVAKVAVGHLAATESQTRLDLVAALQELHSLILLGLIVMLVHRHRELDLFDDNDLLFFAGCTLRFFLFVKVAAVVLDAADRRDGIR